MADHDRPNRPTEDAGGITNRPLTDEIDNQEALPERGTKRDQTADPGARRKEGDYQGGEEVINRDIDERYETPRRYDEGDTDAAMPADDSSLNTKI